MYITSFEAGKSVYNYLDDTRYTIVAVTDKVELYNLTLNKTIFCSKRGYVDGCPNQAIFWSTPTLESVSNHGGVIFDKSYWVYVQRAANDALLTKFVEVQLGEIEAPHIDTWTFSAKVEVKQVFDINYDI